MANEKTSTNPVEIGVAQASASERFTSMVMQQYQQITNSKVELSRQEQRLIRNYFIMIDQTLKKAEEDRARKGKESLPCTWANVNLQQLAVDLAHYARIGLDMAEDNHLFPIPYKDNKAGNYNVTLMEGYNGIRYQAEKYALDPFKSVTTEVIFSKDIFKPIKKDSRHTIEGYEFDVPTPFDRGDLVGVFGYIEYEDSGKNKLVMFTRSDVEKRKPKYASAEFWGGEKMVWKDGKQVATTLDGWAPEMWLKTMKREIYSSKHIPRDPNKIDESYQYVRQREQAYVDIAIEAEVAEKANQAPVMLPPPEAVNKTETPKQEIEPLNMEEITLIKDDNSAEAPF